MAANPSHPLVVVTTDSGPEPALDRVVALLDAGTARLTLVAVCDAVPPDARAALPAAVLDDVLAASTAYWQDRLDVLARHAEDLGMSVSTQVLRGTPYRVVIQEVLRGGHDLVLKSIETPSGVARATQGSTDKHLLRKCPCPLWLVRPGAEPRSRCILAAVDPLPGDGGPDDLARDILRAATGLAARDNAAVHALHAWHVFGEFFLRHPRPLVSDPEADRIVGRAFNRHSRALDDLVESLESPGVAPETHLVHQDAAAAITDFVAAHDVDLLVIGTVGRSGIPGLLMGSTAEQVLGEVSCSIVALKPRGFVSPVTRDS